MTDRLQPYYESELQFLRRFGAEFAEAHPKIAARLRLSDQHSEDPHVSRLVQAFALLAARTRLKLDDDFPEITHAMLGVLYPHYLAPIPSTTVVELALQETQAELVEGYPIPAGESVESEPTDGGSCLFRTGYPLRLFPLRLADASWKGQPFRCPPSPAVVRAEALLHLHLRSFRAAVPISAMRLDQLTFFINGLSRGAMDLQEMLFTQVSEILLARGPDDADPVRLPLTALQPVGYDDAEGLLPLPERSFPGYRLLTEYFACPEKFLFFRIQGLDDRTLAGLGPDLHLFLLMNRHVSDLERFVATDTIRIGCTPLVNLFPHRAEPIRVTQGQSEYRVVPDARQPRAFEVHSIRRVVGTSPDKDEVQYHPFYSVRHAQEREQRRGFYHVHRREAGFAGGKHDAANEVYLSLVDLDFEPQSPANWVLDVEAWCTSRNLAKQLEFGGDRPRLQLLGGGPLAPLKCLTAPRPSHRPPLGKGTYWRLISHLALGHISLFDAADGASPLREVLSLYDYLQTGDTRQRIEAIRSVGYRPAVARCHGGPGGAFCRGLDVDITIDEERLSSGGAYFLGAVLERFLGLYANVNSFTRTSLHSTLREAEIARWPARAGRMTLV